jgi:hypothetical protein
MRGSQIWYGKPSSLTHSSRPIVDKQMVLGESVDLLRCSILREAGHIVAIPPDLSTDDVPKSELRVNRIHHGILLLDHIQCYFQLHSHQLLLDTQH